ncbi:MAG TPA: ThiF family adenylyltransferase [Frankiaceae bacterium]|nr:ThiF family adenylyltransferase [Frankiaceae bacterium]
MTALADRRSVEDVHSRSILAGYSPDVMFSSTVLVVGAGALGQNVLLNLALAGVQQLLVVDHDMFEPHNVTRSPLYPPASDVSDRGLGKAVNVAHRALAVATAPEADIWWAARTIQRVGDGVIRAADVVVSAVDDMSARAWLAERCRVVGRPMVEGGFQDSRYNVSVFGPDPDEACFRCVNPSRESSASCTKYALKAEAAAIVPALQTTAAVAGGLVAEHAIGWLHGRTPIRARRVYGDIRTGSSSVAVLTTSLACPGVHTASGPLVDADIDPNGTVADAASWARRAGYASILLPEPAVVRAACTRCGAVCDVRAGESTWLLSPLCAGCGGPWHPAEGHGPALVRAIDVDHPQDLVDLSLREAGLPPGATLDIVHADGSPAGALLPGSPLDDLRRARGDAGDEDDRPRC